MSQPVIEADQGQDWLSVVSVNGGRPRRLSAAGIRIDNPRFGWAPDSRAIIFISAGGEVSRVELEGDAQLLFPLPEDAGIVWDVVVSSEGDSVATFSHHFGSDQTDYLTFVAPLASGEWSLRVDSPAETFKVALTSTTQRFPSWSGDVVQGVTGRPDFDWSR